MIRHTLITLAIIPLVMIIYLSIPGDMSKAEIKEAYNNLNTQTIASEFDEDNYKEAVKEVSDKVNGKGLYLFPIRMQNGLRTDATLASNVGYRSYDGKFHAGLDINTGDSNDINDKNAAIVSSCDGRVIRIHNAYGAVFIQADDGLIYGYLHMLPKSYANLKVGDAIKQGDKIGMMGATGPKIDAMHLHYQITMGAAYGQALNPWDLTVVSSKKVIGGPRKKLGSNICKYYFEEGILSFSHQSGCGSENDTAFYSKENFVPNPKTGYLPKITYYN